MPILSRYPIRLIVAGAVVLGAACSPVSSATPVVQDPPWERPVAGAVAVTAWENEGQPTSPFGPDGYPWESPESLIDAMARALAINDGVDASGTIVERRNDGTVVGWVRVELVQPGDEAPIGLDMRLELRRRDGSWFVAGNQTREHCARALVEGACR